MDTRMKILLIEDDEDDFVLVRDTLEEIGDTCIELVWIADYRGALNEIRTRQYDVYLLDYRLGERDGIELLKEALDLDCRGPFIFLTGQASREVDLAAMQAGASDFLIKNELNAYLLERSIRYSIEKQRLLNKINHLSLSDDLTGLNNRRGFLALAEQQLKIARRANKPLALLFTDLDDMKRINDTYGHQEGDRALTETARLLRECFRESDIIARIGGDEFVVLFMEDTQFTTQSLLKRLKKCIREFNDSSRTQFSLSLSIGTTQCNAKNICAIHRMMAEADKLMYEEKNRKKNAAIHAESYNRFRQH